VTPEQPRRTLLPHVKKCDGDHGAPYGGFITVSDCSHVTVRNTILTGHKAYRTVGSAGVPVSMGAYDISVNHPSNGSFPGSLMAK